MTKQNDAVSPAEDRSAAASDAPPVNGNANGNGNGKAGASAKSTIQVLSDALEINDSATKNRTELIAAAQKAKARLAKAKANAEREKEQAHERQESRNETAQSDGAAAVPGASAGQSNAAADSGPAVRAPSPSAQHGATRPAGTRRKRRIGTNSLLFILIVIAPVLGTAFYYYAVAKDQYMSVSRFAVRGVEGGGVDGLNLSMLPGATTQATDAYIVNEYIRSVQLINDLRNRWNIDVRRYYARDDIDPLYRIEGDLSPEQFMAYWTWMSESDYNSTTKITTFQVRAFSAEDAKAIADAVIEAAGDLINRLSTDARRQIVRTAQSEVSRTEERLRDARRQLTNFRNREQSLDPTQRANQKETLASGLEKELVDLNLRRTALRSTINAESPTIRVLDRKIRALREELERQRRDVGTGASEAPEDSDKGENLSVVFADYSELQLEENFAETAYTAALSSLESAEADARKQERYFAIVVAPTKPEVSLYPQRLTIILTVFGLSILLWFLAYLILQSIRDHAV